MKKHTIRTLLQNVDEPTALRISEQHPGLTDADNERLLRRIEQDLAGTADTPAPSAARARRRLSRLESLRGIAAAATCFAVCGATCAGLFWLRDHQPVADEQTNATLESATAATAETPAADEVSLTAGIEYALGEPCPASHLCASGTVLVTAEKAETDADGCCAVTVTLESENAVAWDGGRIFLLDNLLLETEQGLLSPCGTDREPHPDVYPFAVALPDGASETITVYYQTDGNAPTVLHTGADRTAPCIRLNEGERS